METKQVVASGLIAAVVGFALLRRRRVSAVESDPTVDDTGAAAQREVAKKRKLQERFAAAGGSGAEELQRHRWAPGQIPPKNFRTKRWLRTDLGAPIQDKDYSLDESVYQLTISVGANNEKQVTLDLEQIQSIGIEKFENVDWHCVTGWSYTGLTLYGVSLQKLLQVALGDAVWNDDWTCLFQVSADGYTCPVIREDALNDKVFFATRDSTGKLLSFEHGGPRIVFPHLWGWKSSKYLTEIRLLPDYQPGYWEKLMCHKRGRIYTEDGTYLEERWTESASRVGFHDAATGMVNLYHRLFGAEVYAFTMWFGGKLLGIMTRPLLFISKKE